MRTPRQLSIDRALLQALANVPDTLLLPEAVLHADAARVVFPRPSTAELDEAIRHADMQKRIAGIAGEEGMTWQITNVGRLWRARHG